VFCLIRKSSNLQWIENLEVELLTGKYSDKKFLSQAVGGMDYIFHLGAVIDASNWNIYYRVNVENTINLLNACVGANPGIKKFIFVSSIAAAGPSINKEPLKESDEGKTVSLYGKSKYMAEKASRAFFDKLPVVILRPTNVLGIRQKELLSILMLVRKRIIPLLGNGDKQTSICFVQDVVRALIMAAENKKVKGKTYFLASEEAYSWRVMLDFIRREFNYSLVLKIPYPVLLLTAFLAKLVADLTGNRPLITPRELSSVRKHYWIHDVTLIKKELGFSPEIKFEAGLNKIINWYRQNGYF
jgi:nucleoside-diphosphate-sugar epimerase